MKICYFFVEPMGLRSKGSVDHKETSLYNVEEIRNPYPLIHGIEDKS